MCKRREQEGGVGNVWHVVSVGGEIYYNVYGILRGDWWTRRNDRTRHAPRPLRPRLMRRFMTYAPHLPLFVIFVLRELRGPAQSRTPSPPSTRQSSSVFPPCVFSTRSGTPMLKSTSVLAAAIAQGVRGSCRRRSAIKCHYEPPALFTWTRTLYGPLLRHVTALHPAAAWPSIVNEWPKPVGVLDERCLISSTPGSAPLPRCSATFLRTGRRYSDITASDVSTTWQRRP